MINQPKIELHVHLEGTTSPALAQKIAKRNKIKLNPHFFLANAEGYQSVDFPHFLQVFDDLSAIICHPIDYHDIVYDYLRRSALESTLYVELMYSPLHAEKMTGIPSKEHLAAITDAIRLAETNFGIMARIIMTGVRHFGIESCEVVANNVLKNPSTYVTGFGLGGDEINFPAPLFQKAYQIAKDAGLGLTIHAGEFGTAESILDTIHYCGVSRIGHGVSAIKSDKVLHTLIDNDIHLEICPSSNLHFLLFANIESHPILSFYKQGISLSINSDDPPFFNTSLGQEYQKLKDYLGFSQEDFKKINSMAINHAFIDKRNKEKLLAKINVY